MKRYGIVSYNMHCNFTNYGSALQTYALHTAINRLAPDKVKSMVIDYCPDVLKDVDVLNPFNKMWDKDTESRKMCELSMPAIRQNYKKFLHFYDTRYEISKGKYSSDNFDDSLIDENLDGYVCGSDTIWCIREFNGFDDGYYGNYPVMKKSYTISYAASFGDVVFTIEELETLKKRLLNFKAIAVRENFMLDYIRKNVSVPVVQVLDPTLLLTGEDYQKIAADIQSKEPYILLYARRYNPKMEEYADRLAKKYGVKVIEISLRAINAYKHEMRYDAGVEEFIALSRDAECVVTNSFHGAIFAIQMHTPVHVFSREQADSKIDDLLGIIGLRNFKLVTGEEKVPESVDFEDIEKRLVPRREASLKYLKEALCDE